MTGFESGDPDVLRSLFGFLCTSIVPFAVPYSIAFAVTRAFKMPIVRSLIVASGAASIGFGLFLLAFSEPRSVIALGAHLNILGQVFWLSILPSLVATLGAGVLAPAYPKADANDDVFVDVYRLPPEVTAPIRENLDRRAAVGRSNGESLRKLKFVYTGHTEMVAASERAFRQETAALEAQEARDLAKARSEFLSLMNPTDRGLFAARQAIRADAEVRAATKHRELDAENGTLRQKVEILVAEKKAVESERASLAKQIQGLAAEIKKGEAWKAIAGAELY